MQQFQVPQFITVEDKIIGPFTLKQFLYLLGAAAVLLLTWFFFHIILFLIIGLPLTALFTAMAFVKLNGQPFPTVFANAINYYLKPRLYLWQKTRENREKSIENRVELKGRAVESPLEGIQKLSENRLSDLAWSLDVKERLEDRG